MSHTSLIGGFVAFLARMPKPASPARDLDAPSGDASRTPWQHELDRAHAARRDERHGSGPTRDVMAAFATTLDPLLLADKGVGPTGIESSVENASTEERAVRLDRAPVASGAVDGPTRSPRQPRGSALVSSSPDERPADGGAIDPRASRIASRAAGTTSVQPPATSAAADLAGSLSSMPAGRAGAIPPTAMPRHWPFMAGAIGDAAVESIGVADANAPTTLPASTQLHEALSSALHPHAPIRLHIEWSAAGAKVWIGLDAAGDAAPVIDRVVAALNRTGARLRSVVCNGTPVPITDRPVASRSAASLPIDLLIERNPSWPPSAP